jgi:UDP-N-acetylglucosamine enolpyruvyl transferase
MLLAQLSIQGKVHLEKIGFAVFVDEITAGTLSIARLFP